MLIERTASTAQPYYVSSKGSSKVAIDVAGDTKADTPIGDAQPVKARRILVVDDEMPILRLLRRILIASGYEVLVASSGKQGLNAARQEQPDLILLDLSMPGMDGLAVCRELRQWTETPIIVVSARGEERYKVHALDLGAYDYLT